MNSGRNTGKNKHFDRMTELFYSERRDMSIAFNAPTDISSLSYYFQTSTYVINSLYVELKDYGLF
jgi:hypothetical protein